MLRYVTFFLGPYKAGRVRVSAFARFFIFFYSVLVCCVFSFVFFSLASVTTHSIYFLFLLLILFSDALRLNSVEANS